MTYGLTSNLSFLCAADPAGETSGELHGTRLQWRTNPVLALLGPFERFFYRLAGIRPDDEMNWKTYGLAVLGFSLVGIVFLYALQRFSICCRSTQWVLARLRLTWRSIRLSVLSLIPTGRIMAVKPL